MGLQNHHLHPSFKYDADRASGFLENGPESRTDKETIPIGPLELCWMGDSKNMCTIFFPFKCLIKPFNFKSWHTYRFANLCKCWYMTKSGHTWCYSKWLHLINQPSYLINLRNVSHYTWVENNWLQRQKHFLHHQFLNIQKIVEFPCCKWKKPQRKLWVQI
jgi:hypothetical protein